MSATLSITESDLFTALAVFMRDLLGNIAIVRGLDNRVPMPADAAGFIVVTGGKLVPLSTPVARYGGVAQTLDITTPHRWNVAFDCYGAQAQNWAVTLSSVFRTPYACDLLAGLQPLYTDDAGMFPLVDGEAQWLARWRFDAAFQYNPVIGLPQQSALALTLGVVSVDAQYPPAAP